MSAEEDAQIQTTSVTSPSLVHACDRCHRRKIRCDKTIPCAGCRSIGVDCVRSRRPRMQDRKRVLISAQYERKIDQLTEELNRVSKIVEALHEGSSASSRQTCITTPSHGHEGIASAVTADSIFCKQSLSGALTSEPAVAGPSYMVDNDVAIEGKSSLAATSAFGVDFIQNIAKSSHCIGGRSEVQELLKNLRNTVASFKSRRSEQKTLFPLTPSLPSGGRQKLAMPPIQVAFTTISNAQDESDFTYLCLSSLLSPRNLSDLCMKVYCSSQHSDIEFFIINAALYFLTVDPRIFQNDTEGHSQFEIQQQMYRANMENMLARLPLYLDESYEMVLALVLGVFYALDSSRTHLAWTLITAAHQCSYSLGYHTHPDNSNEPLNSRSQTGLLFWTVYYLEKTLCLRIGRSSTITDSDITISRPKRPPESNSYHLDYINLQLKLASLAARIYELLFSAGASRISRNERTQRALELYHELHGYCEKVDEIIQLWKQSTANYAINDQLQIITSSDKVFRLSLKTLISQAISTPEESTSCFSEECISSARDALDCHQKSVADFSDKGLLFVSSYINWTILFTPFTAFIVVFCHVIESGDVEDLRRIRTFADSIQEAAQYCKAILKHKRLFSAFVDVAVHYTKLKSSPGSHQGKFMYHRVEEGWQQSIPDEQTQGASQTNNQPQEAVEMIPSSLSSIEPLAQGQSIQGLGWNQQDLWGGNWFSINQQIMELMEQDAFSF
ncbi:hypothetical protein BDV40DRAFT_273732 [Aspergillus tamarii]|uniref:Zn(2)-C6 fungal-type domain-containing protein n=2 Tax=Aspergillus subgen. Circumdati TaxID=2720871 RepID=A0A5N6UKV5_ASPTM|nr:hypothetical protein BDV40DRAFT_273732 [Aspergillus tamarii]